MALREFQFVRLKPQALKTLRFPLRSDEGDQSPLAGPFSPRMIQLLDRWIGVFPFAKRVEDGRRAWRVCQPKQFAMELELLSDGSLFARGIFEKLNIICAVYLHLLEPCPFIGLEDCSTSFIYSPSTLPKLSRPFNVSTVIVH